MKHLSHVAVNTRRYALYESLPYRRSTIAFAGRMRSHES
jgi:hypothetical protein